MNREVKIKLVKDWPDDQIIELYKVGGWWDGSGNGSVVKKIITGSFVFAVAVDKATGRAVGMGRVMSDGVSDAYIQDVVVMPEFRKQDLGKKLILALRDFCLAKGVAWVALVAEAGTEEFYQGLGFRVMKGHTPMRYMEG